MIRKFLFTIEVYFLEPINPKTHQRCELLKIGLNPDFTSEDLDEDDPSLSYDFSDIEDDFQTSRTYRYCFYNPDKAKRPRRSYCLTPYEGSGHVMHVDNSRWYRFWGQFYTVEDVAYVCEIEPRNTNVTTIGGAWQKLDTFMASGIDQKLLTENERKDRRNWILNVLRKLVGLGYLKMVDLECCLDYIRDWRGLKDSDFSRVSRCRVGQNEPQRQILGRNAFGPCRTFANVFNQQVPTQGGITQNGLSQKVEHHNEAHESMTNENGPCQYKQWRPLTNQCPESLNGAKNSGIHQDKANQNAVDMNRCLPL